MCSISPRSSRTSASVVVNGCIALFIIGALPHSWMRRGHQNSQGFRGARQSDLLPIRFCLDEFVVDSALYAAPADNDLFSLPCNNGRCAFMWRFEPIHHRLAIHS